ncbi:MAG TPA: signal peptidase I [Armatimonadota bacterium]|nr:signal peptidase I [Armatimonadota bacterium]
MWILGLPRRSTLGCTALWHRFLGKRGDSLRARLIPLLTLLICLGGVWRWSPFRLGVVCGHSMHPTLRNGSLFLIERGYYQSHPIRRGDVIVFRTKKDACVKRVYAIGGDLICVLVAPETPTVLIDPERYPALVDTLSRRQHAAGTPRIFRVPPHTVFVLGDNIGVSRDSRHFGLVAETQVIGRVLGVGHGRPAPRGVILRGTGPVPAHPHPSGPGPMGPVYHAGGALRRSPIPSATLSGGKGTRQRKRGPGYG